MKAAFADELRILPHVIAYEWRKASAFRMGLLIREGLRGIGRPIVAMLVYFAMFSSPAVHDLNGYSLKQLLAYLVWTAVFFKCLTDEKSLDIAEQIFDGYITKYLVMPVGFFTLVLGRFVQLTVTQVLASLLFWGAGALLLPAHWPYPGSALALAQASLLVALGAYCYLLVHFILSCLAFWLDVVWSLMAMFRFVSMFVAGVLVPVALMPAAVQGAFRYLFPYWTVFAPAELMLGRMGGDQLATGVLVLGAWIIALQVLAAWVWRRGVARFAGAGA